MKKKKIRAQFDATEFLLLAFVAVALLTLVAWQTGNLPTFVTQAVLGVSTIR